MPENGAFLFPMRDADIWGLNEDGAERDPEEVAADLEFNQRAEEDYLNNTLPNVFIQQSSLGSGFIDPAQLASGTAGAGKAPVGNPPAWTDIATQAELDAVAATITAHPFGANDLQRGVASISDMNGTNTTFAVTFGVAFSAVPRVTATVECGARIGVFPTLITVNTTSFVGMIWTSATMTATVRVHYFAVKA